MLLAAEARWPAVCSVFFFSLSFLCFSLFSVSSSLVFSFGVFPLLCSLSSLLLSRFVLSLDLLSSSIFFLLLPCFYRQKIRETWLGRPLCCHPKPPKGYIPSILPPRGKQVDYVGVFLREMAVIEKKNLSSSSPASRV